MPKLYKKTIGPDEEPRNLFTKITRLCNQYRAENPVTKEMKMSYVIQQAPLVYRIALASEKIAKGKECKDLHDCMQDVWRAGRHEASMQAPEKNRLGVNAAQWFLSNPAPNNAC